MRPIPLLALALLLLGACTTSPSPTGADRDAHGCIASAGYGWCERSRQCERPWELARREGLADGKEAVLAYCAAPKR